MKKTIIVLMLFISILPELYAQSNPKADKVFEVPKNSVNRRYYIFLEKGNRFVIELSSDDDMNRITNIDSLLKVFLNDIKPLKDSLSDPLSSKRIDYVIDPQGRKKIRLQQYHPKADNYLLTNGELSSLKISQDTISIIGITLNPGEGSKKINSNRLNYFHLIFYLNNMDELTSYMNGILAAKIETIQKNVNGKWPLLKGGSSHYMANDKSIVADKPHGWTGIGTGDMLAIMLSVNIQNYKNYFVPSFSLGFQITHSNRQRTFKWEPGLFWEPHFFFAKDAQGNLKTYRNDFLTLTYGQGGVKNYDPRKDFSFSAVLSLGYLIHRSGDLIEKNTFRLGMGKVKLLKTTIEPSLYFNNFFKGVTPGIRISQSF